MGSGRPTGPGAPRATRQLVALVAFVGVVVAVVAVFAVARSGEPRSQGAGDAAAGAVTTTTTPPSPPDGSLRLVEKGFSIATPHPDYESSPQRMAYMGLIVENTSDQIAVSTPITYHYVDSAGDLIPSDYAEVEIAALGPGQRFAWGDFDRLRPGPPAELVVDVGEPGQWIAPGSLSDAERDWELPGADVSPTELELMDRATVDDVAVRYGGGELTVSFTVSSEDRQELSGYAGLILRNRAGQIVMGWPSLVELGPGTTAVEEQIPIFDLEPVDRGRLAELDPAQTEVYFGGYL